MEIQPLPKDIGQKIKKIRGNLSQAEFAKRVGIKRSLISSYESGERIPSMASLRKLASCGRINMEYLLGIENAPSHKLTPEEERLLHLLRKSPPQTKAPPLNIFLYLSLIVGLIVYLRYLGIW